MITRNEWEKESRGKKDSMVNFPLMIAIIILFLISAGFFVNWFWNKIWGG